MTENREADNELLAQQEGNEEQERGTSCPGYLLTEAREAKGLTVRAVSSELRLNVQLIEALESGELNDLPPMTFVNGYLRSYAKLLGLDADPLVEQYNLCAVDAPELVSTDKTSSEVKSGDLPMRLVTYLVVIGLLVLLVMWWSANQGGLPSEEVVGSRTATVIDRETSVPEAAAVTEVEQPEAEPQSDGLVSAEAERVDSETESVAEVAVEAVAEPESDPQQEVDGTVSEGVPALEPEPVVLIEPLTDEMPQSTLKIELNEDSWLEIKDAAGRRLAYGLGEAGEERELRGEAPFSVFLGYAPGVEIQYNGKPFDHAPFRRRDLARFRVGRSSDNQPREP